MTALARERTALGLIARVLRDVPRLEGAACAADPHLFDPRTRAEPDDQYAARVAYARRVCVGCPALDDCRAWLDTHAAGYVRGLRPPPETDSTTTKET